MDAVRNRRTWAGLALLLLVAVACRDRGGEKQAPVPSPMPVPVAGGSDAGGGDVVRCAVVGGLVISGLWPALMKRYEAETGSKTELTVSGNKRMIVPAVQAGDVDLITMHASEAMDLLVAEGHTTALDAWAQNDHVIVGPAEDPAKVRGMTDGAAALKKIVASKSTFVAHRGHGASQALAALLDHAGVALDETRTFRLSPEDNQESVLELASKKRAYSLVGRIPVTVGKMQGTRMDILVAGDPRLRRAYVVAVADPKRWPAARVSPAQKLSAYLRSPATQAWIADYSRSATGEGQAFFPVSSGDTKNEGR